MTLTYKFFYIPSFLNTIVKTTDDIAIISNATNVKAIGHFFLLGSSISGTTITSGRMMYCKIHKKT